MDGFVNKGAIIDKSIWDRVQEQMTKNAVVRKCATNAKSPSLLTGLLFDENGARLKPSHACKADRRYRYYITDPDPDPDPEGILEGSETWRLLVAFRRRGVEKRIVIRDEHLARREPDPKLIELIAQAHAWFAELTTGDTSSVRELATKYDVDQGDVSRCRAWFLI